MAVPLTLKVFKGDALVAEKEFERDIIKIGRLSSAHLCLDDEKVSRIHSVIEAGADGTLSIIDMGSVEGTYVNGKRVNKGALAFGDEIRVGGTLLRLERPGAARPAEAAPVAAVSPPPAPVEVFVPAAAPAAAVAVAAPVAAPVVAAPPPVAMDPSFASTEKVAVIAPAPVRAPAASGEAARVRPAVRKGSGPQGLEVRLYWGDQMVASEFLRPGVKRSFSVGSAPGVDFIMGDSKLGGPSFEAVRSDGHTFTVRFTGKMSGSLTRGTSTQDLKAVLEGRHASHDGDAYGVTLERDDFIQVDLGGVTLEAFPNAMPKPVLVPFLETVDFGFLNVLLVMFILYSLFVVSAVTRTEDGEGFADELSSNKARIAKLIVKPPEIQKNPLLQKLEAQKEQQRAQATARSKGKEGKAGSRSKDASNAPVKASPQGEPNNKDRARQLVANLFGGKGGAASLLGKAGIGGELKAAVGGITGASSGTQAGFGGLSLRGDGGGGGGTGEVAVIGGIGTRGVGGGDSAYGAKSGGLGGKKSVAVSIASSDPMVTGSLDKELIRAVIRANMGQVKYCYESQLNRHPNLAGTVKVKFVISATGRVSTSQVDHSTVGNAEMETCLAGRVRSWQFPKPKGGGVVIVNYPFSFKSGS